MKRISAAFLPLAFLLFVPAAASSQACLGLPGDGGTFTYGFEGTDGAVGEGFAVSVRHGPVGADLSRRSLDMFTFAEPARTWELRGTLAVQEGGLEVCAVTGARTTGYVVDRHFVTRRDPDSGVVIEEHRLEGEYDRVRVPVGLAFGGELRVWDWLGLAPFVTADLLYQRERFERYSSAARLPPGPVPTRTGARSTVGFGGSAGLTVEVHRVLLRTVIHHVVGGDEMLSGRTSFPGLSAHLGVAF